MQLFGPDVISTTAGLATILATAETAPSVQRRRASRSERREAYLTFQRAVYRQMAGVSHLSVIAQIKTTSWRTNAVAAIPLVGPFMDYVLPTELSERPIVRQTQEILKTAGIFSKAASPAAGLTLAAVQGSDYQFRDRIIADLGAIRDSTGDFLAALAKVRLVGRPMPVEAANVILVLVRELTDRIPTQDDRPLYRRIVSRADKSPAQRLTEFNDCMAALGDAHRQFIAAIRSDDPSRRYPWQVWRRAGSQLHSASQLLAKGQLAIEPKG